MNDIQSILESPDKNQVQAMFCFRLNQDSDEEIIVKFNLWVRHQFPKQFTAKDALFHHTIDSKNLSVYRGETDSFTDIVFRGGGKTSRTKMFFAFVILCDEGHYRRFIKVLTKDGSNSKQIVTDIYNILVNRKTQLLFPDIFEKTNAKREETMGSFTTSYGVKLTADTVGTDQRGDVQGDEESARPDLILFDDFETRKTLRSAVETKAIWDNMEEARLGLSKNGGCIYNSNYISERGNVHKLIQRTKISKAHDLLIVPIVKNGEPTWDLYTLQEIEVMRKTDDDFAGERLCIKPNTPILTDEGWREISSVKVGDKVTTHLGGYQKIVRVMKSKAKDLLDITVNGKVVTITKNHPVLISRGEIFKWIPAGELTINDLTLSVPRGKLIT